MACIIKLPNESKGIISFTSPESREVIRGETQQYLQANRKDWIYLLHHNWQPCTHNSFYDASLCNTIDLSGAGRCMGMDCCNFSPSIYTPSNEKTFDVLFVTRAVTFKRLNIFYDVCKKLMTKNPDIKILLICSVPESDCDPPNPKQIYLSKFSREERSNFLALFFDYDYPFPMDKQYLAHFYRSSKVFLHTADQERHPRVCSYAWASGIPVVGYRPLATFLSNKFIQEPYFYQVNNDVEYVDQTLNAIDVNMPYDEIKYEVNEDYSISRFMDKIKDLHSNISLENVYGKNLDFRMGRHCTISLGDNSLPISIPDLMEMGKKHGHNINTNCGDLEIELMNYGK
ncbi:MAG: hypothetical protein ACTSW1_07430 [Candidatus Hodarchaeales archaeon]